MTLPFAERYRQARLYAAQVRVRRAMGDRHILAKPINRKLPCIRIRNVRSAYAQLEAEPTTNGSGSSRRTIAAG
jgi:hypothetical protein